MPSPHENPLALHAATSLQTLDALPLTVLASKIGIAGMLCRCIYDYDTGDTHTRTHARCVHAGA